MFRINREADYAIRVIVALAKQPPETIISSALVRHEMLIPTALSQRIVAKLAKSGLINTYPGRNGGIQLAHPPSEITLHQVVEIFDGPIIVSDCLSKSDACSFSGTCPVQHRWGRLRAVIVKELESTSFDELALGAVIE
ncbi:MAG: Rrf2 family transcriptional regulator [Chloroflexota bacterium]